MKTICLLFLAGLSLNSCKNSFFYADLYTRADRKSKFFMRSYSRQTEFSIHKIQACHFTETTGRLSTSGKIHFNRDSIELTIQQAYSRRLNITSISTSKQDLFDKKCTLPDELVTPSHDLSQGGEKACKSMILTLFSVSTKSIKRTEGGGGITPAFDAGDDKHLLEYKLTTAIYQNDTLIYMDNRTHWTEVFSDRGEQLMYEVPQVVIDSLVTLTLQEYFKRVK